MQKYPIHLLKVIEALKKLPGVGAKTAERFAFEMINWQDLALKNMAQIILSIPNELKICPECGALSSPSMCSFCVDSSRRSKILCLVATPKDVFSIEATHEYRGHYHVLGCLLSPLNGIGCDSLPLDRIKKRIADLKVEEVVIALDSTLEGDTTALYIKQELEALNIEVSRLAFGLPMGSSFDYVDGGTLAKALTARSRF